MKKTRWSLFFLVLLFFCDRGVGLAESMYVTDRLFLALRDAPDLEEPSLMLLPSTTEVEVLQTEGRWAEVMLENGRTGWVLRRYLVKDLYGSQIIEELKGQLKDKDLILERLQEENASLKEEFSDLQGEKAKTAAMKREIEDLKNRIIHQNQSLEKAKEQYRSENRKILYGTGFLALVAGLIAGYLVRRPSKNRYYLR